MSRRLRREQSRASIDADALRLGGTSQRHNAVLDVLREEAGYHTAWARWSASADEIAVLIDRIGRHPARSIDDMLIKYEALQWSLLDDGAVFDTAVRRQVVAFRRDLAALASSR